MTNDPQEELISAYLDGELSVDQQRRVERLLAENAEYRQLHDELRALHNSFETLPRYRLPEDLSQRVLRRAEQESLREGALPHDGSKVAGGNIDSNGDAAEMHVVRAPEPERPGRYPRGWRAIFWPVMVVAAAIAMMVVGPKQRDRGRDIARAPSDAAPSDAAPSVAAPSDAAPAAEMLADQQQPPAEIGAAPADFTAKSAVDAAISDRKEANGAVNGKWLGAKRDAAADNRQQPQLPEAAAPAGLRERNEKSAKTALGLRRKSSTADESEVEPAEVGQLGADRSAGDRLPDERSLGDLEETGKSPQRRDTATAANKLAGETDEVHSGDVSSNGISVPAAPMAGLAGRAVRGAGNIPAPQSAPAVDADSSLEFFQAADALAVPQAGAVDAFARSTYGAAADDTYVIEVNLTPAAAREQAFEKLLARHQLVQLSTDQESRATLDNQTAAAVPQPTAAGKSPLPAVMAKKLPAGPAAVEGRYATPRGEVDSSLLREVTVAATADQFVATLRDLREHPDQFAEAKFGFAAAPATALNRTRQLPAEQPMLERAATAGPAVSGRAGEDAAAQGAAAQDAAAGAAAVAGPGKGEASETAEPKSAGSLTRQAVRGGVRRAQAVPLPGALAKKVEPRQSDLATPATDKNDVAKDGAAKDDAAKDGDGKGGAANFGFDKSQPRAADDDVTEKTAQAKDLQQKSGAVKSGSGQAGTAAPAGAPAAGFSAGSESGGIQLNSKAGGLQLKLAPAQASGGRGASGSNSATSAPGGGAGGGGAAAAVPPAGVGFGGAKAIEPAPGKPSAPAKPSAATADQLARQAAPTVKLIFRLRVAEAAAAEHPAAAEPAAAGPPAAAPPAEPAVKEAP